MVRVTENRPWARGATAAWAGTATAARVPQPFPGSGTKLPGLKDVTVVTVATVL